jgi:hypothetical protein
MPTRTLHRRLLGTVMAAAVLAACEPAPTPSAQGAAEPVIAIDEQGLFRLELELPKATYAAGEPIEGVARLWFAGPGVIEVAGSGSGLIGFTLLDVDRNRGLGFAMTGDCVAYSLDAANPYTAGLIKSGAFDSQTPEHAWIEAFLSDPVYRLPAGTYEIGASASFLGKGCELPTTELSAAVRITVTD